MNGWLWTLIGVSIYAAGWYITPFMMVWVELRFPQEGCENPADIRRIAENTAEVAHGFAVAWPVIWLVLLVLTAGRLHRKSLQKMIDKPLPGEARVDYKAIKELEREIGIGPASQDS